MYVYRSYFKDFILHERVSIRKFIKITILSNTYILRVKGISTFVLFFNISPSNFGVKKL